MTCGDLLNRPVVRKRRASLVGNAFHLPVFELDRGEPAKNGNRDFEFTALRIDFVDPAFAPGTGTPVWGGLTSAQAAHILRDLAGINMVGGDMVEVSPPFDTTGATAIAGAHVATELLCLWCWNHRETRKG